MIFKEQDEKCPFGKIQLVEDQIGGAWDLRGCLSKNRPLNFVGKIILPETVASERLYRDYN